MRYVALGIASTLLGACGSAPPPPAPIVVHDPPPRSTVPAPVSCGDAGVILRGTVDNPKTAGPAKEAAIASACLIDKWSREILDCIGRERETQECLTKLDPAQRASLDKKLKAWATANDEFIDDEPAVPEVSCAAGVGDVEAYTPAIKLAGEERDFALALRRKSLVAMCEQGWLDPAKACFAGKQRTTDDCRKLLEAAQQQEVTDQLARIDALLAKIVAAKAKPAKTYDCAAVVAVHYSDAAWKGKAEPPKNPKATRTEILKAQQDRKQMIADSRKLMLDTCTKESWNATVRACELIGGGEMCSHAAGREPRWGFPARGVIVNSGIPECDSYLAVVRSLIACPKLPAPAKESLLHSLDAQRQGWGQMTGTASIVTACQQGEQALRQAAPALGCTI